MIRLAIDAMGGDQGVAPLVQGCQLALLHDPKLQLQVIGDTDQLASCMSFLNDTKASSGLRHRIEVVHASSEVDMTDDPLSSLRNKTDSSMAIAMDMLANKEVDAVVSAGNTGALVAFGVQKVGTQEGVTRPAICTQVPTTSGKTWLLDLGAMLSNDEDRLVELAKLGAQQARDYDGLTKPKVALLNVGVESLKGTPELQGAASRLELEEGLRYEGFVEGSSIFSGAVDVIVCDGFSGNVAIKTAQGVASLLMGKFAAASRSNFLKRAALAVVAPTLRHLGDDLNPSLYNGAPLLGLRQLVVKSHGHTDASGFANAIGVATKMAVAS